MCEESPLGLNAFLSTRPPEGLKNIRYFCSIISYGKLLSVSKIMIKSSGYSMHMGHGVESWQRTTYTTMSGYLMPLIED